MMLLWLPINGGGDSRLAKRQVVHADWRSIEASPVCNRLRYQLATNGSLDDSKAGRIDYAPIKKSRWWREGEIKAIHSVPIHGHASTTAWDMSISRSQERRENTWQPLTCCRLRNPKLPLH